MGAADLPSDIGKRLQRLEAEVKALRKRAPLTNASISSGGLLVQDGGNIVVKGGGSLLIEDAAGNVLMQFGLLPDGHYGLVVNDSGGDPQVRAGELESGGYGLEAVDPTGNLVQLSTLAFGLASATVFAQESTSSATLTDLATLGPAVSCVIGPSGRALVTVTALMTYTVDRGCVMGFAVSGATTVAGDLNHTVAINTQDTTTLNATGNMQASGTFLVTGLNPGVNTFTAKYATMFSGSVQFGFYRNITVQPF